MIQDAKTQLKQSEESLSKIVYNAIHSASVKGETETSIYFSNMDTKLCEKMKKEMNTKQKIFNIAEQVNNRAKSLFNSDTLDTYCGICSGALVVVLHDNNIESQFCYGTYIGFNHCWVETEEFLVDITSRQFEDENFDIEIHLMDEIYDEEKYDKEFDIKFRSFDQFINTIRIAVPDWVKAKDGSAPNRSNILSLVET